MDNCSPPKKRRSKKGGGKFCFPSKDFFAFFLVSFVKFRAVHDKKKKNVETFLLLVIIFMLVMHTALTVPM